MLFYTINNENINQEDYQILAEQTFAPTLQAKNDMFMRFEGIDPVEPPDVGDVIWTHTSGNQHIACGIWQKTPDSEIDFNALRLICKSVLKKAKDLRQLAVSMPLLTINDDLGIWKIVYPIIEEVFNGEDVQVIVHIPTEARLIQVLDSIGGHITRFEGKAPEIRFVKSQTSDK